MPAASCDKPAKAGFLTPVACSGEPGRLAGRPLSGVADLNAIHYYSLRFTDAHTMIVCICRRISDKTIAQCARSGMGFDDIQLELGVATQCGQCEGCARALWSECSPQQTVAHISREAVALAVTA